MTKLLLLLTIVLLTLTVVGRGFRNKHCGKSGKKKDNHPGIVSKGTADDDCQKKDGSSDCSESCFCDDKWLTRLNSDKEDWYYNDEELDRFIGRKGDDYNDAETEAFEEVLHTLKQKEVKDWLHCIALRGIELPAELKDEAILLLEQKINS